MPDGRLRRAWALTLDGSSTSAAPVSPDGTVRLRSNADGTAIEASYDGAAYTTLCASTGKWNAIVNPDGNAAFTHAAYTTAFTWNATTSTNDLFTLQNTSDDTGTGALFAISTPGTANAKDPFRITAQTNRIVEVSSTGQVNLKTASSSGGPIIGFYRYRNTLAAKWNVASGDSLGTVGWIGGADTGGSPGDEVQVASFAAIAARDFTESDYGGGLRFQTKDSAESVSLRNRMWITSLGYVGIGQNIAASDVTHRFWVESDAKIGTGDGSTYDPPAGITTPTCLYIADGTSGTPSTSASPMVSLIRRWNATSVAGVGAGFHLDLTNDKTGQSTTENLSVRSRNNGTIDGDYIGIASRMVIEGAPGTGTSMFAMWALAQKLTRVDAGAAEYAFDNQYSRTISAATNATPIEITVTFAHYLTTGDEVYIADVGGNTAANGTMWAVTVVNSTKFTLDTSVGNGAYTSGGTVYLHNARDYGTAGNRGYAASYFLGAGNSYGNATAILVIGSGDPTRTQGYTGIDIRPDSISPLTHRAIRMPNTDYLDSWNADDSASYHLIGLAVGNTVSLDPDGRTIYAGTGPTQITNANGTLRVAALDSAVGGAPAGSGSELQYRVDASTFGAVTNSSVSTSGFTLQSDDGSSTITAYTFHVATPSVVGLARGRGTAAAPTAVQADDLLGSFQWGGQYDSTVGHVTASATIIARAAANFTATNDAQTDITFNTKGSGNSAAHTGLRVTSDQRVGVGYDIAHADVTHRLTVVGDVKIESGNFIQNAATNTQAQQSIYTWGSSGPLFVFHRSLGTQASATAVTSGTPLGQIRFNGNYDTTSITLGDEATGTSVNQIGAIIMVEAAANWNATDNPADIRFRTGTTVGVSRANAMIITSDRRTVVGDAVVHADATRAFNVKGSWDAFDDTSIVSALRAYGSGSCQLHLFRGRGTAASPSAVLNTDALGAIVFGGSYDGTTGIGSAFNDAARIVAEAQNDWGSLNWPADLLLMTKPVSGLSVRTVIRLTSGQRCGIGDNITHSAITHRLFVDGDARFTGQVQFSPTATLAGLNVGSVAGDPSSLVDGDVWYDSTGHTLDARINGATVSLGASAGANTALSNLASVSINASLIPQTTLDLGAAATAWRNLYIYGAGTFGSTSLKFHGTPTGNRVITFPDATATVTTGTGTTNTVSYWVDANTVGAVTSSTVSGANVTWGGTQTQTLTDTGTSSTVEWLDQNITISPASSAASRTYYGLSQNFAFGTAQAIGTVHAIHSSFTHSQNAAVTAYRGMYFDVTKNTGSNLGTLDILESVATVNAGTTSQARGSVFDLEIGASGTVTSAMGFYALAGNAGTLTTFTAFRAFYSGTVANPYGFASSIGFLHGLGTLTPAYTLDVRQTTSATATVSTIANHDYTSSGTPAAGFGQSHLYALKSSTTAAQIAAQNDIRWQDATHASRSAVYSVKTTANAVTKERMLLGGYKSLSDATATDIFNVTFASAEQKAAGGIVIITCIAKKADTTDTHAITETVAWTAGHWNGSSSINVGLVTGSSKAVGSAGAYALTYSTSGGGTDTLTFRVSADTTLNVATEIYFQVVYGGDAEVTLA